MTECHLVTNKMDVNLDMFSSLVVHRIRSQIHGRDIVTVDETGARRRAMQIDPKVDSSIGLRKAM